MNKITHKDYTEMEWGIEFLEEKAIDLDSRVKLLESKMKYLIAIGGFLTFDLFLITILITMFHYK